MEVLLRLFISLCTAPLSEIVIGNMICWFIQFLSAGICHLVFWFLFVFKLWLGKHRTECYHEERL